MPTQGALKKEESNESGIKPHLRVVPDEAKPSDEASDLPRVGAEGEETAPGEHDDRIETLPEAE